MPLAYEMVDTAGIAYDRNEHEDDADAVRPLASVTVTVTDFDPDVAITPERYEREEPVFVADTAPEIVHDEIVVPEDAVEVAAMLMHEYPAT